ncbi:hypothetical protein F4604DRAFT_1788905 [Suillus subluteus]|nr:hypothetical protein F4604DRAFT_1788905 [Suillus subluteus]
MTRGLQMFDSMFLIGLLPQSRCTLLYFDSCMVPATWSDIGASALSGRYALWTCLPFLLRTTSWIMQWMPLRLFIVEFRRFPRIMQSFTRMVFT